MIVGKMAERKVHIRGIVRDSFDESISLQHTEPAEQQNLRNFHVPVPDKAYQKFIAPLQRSRSVT